MSEQVVYRRAPLAIVSDIILPGQTNNHGTMFGGEVLAMMDKAASIASIRYCRQLVVTASTERIDFRTPIHRGDMVDMYARVIFTGTTSMIVRIDAWTERALTGEREWCTTGYYAMVAVDINGRPSPIPPLLVETDEERENWERGEEIRAVIKARTRDARNQQPPRDPQQEQA